MEPQKITCLIVDDEPMALSLIEGYVLKTPFLELKQKCSNGLEALDFLNKEQVDLVFLDIQMPDLTGLELSKVISKDTKIVFTTAFDQYAIEGFKAEALDYLLKPFDYAEFLTAANKAKEWFKLVRSKSGTISHQNMEFLFVRSEYKQTKIKLNEVLYFEGLKDYIKIWLKDESKPVLTLMSLKALEEELPSDQFMRVHRSFIIALNEIEAVERGQVLIANKRITVSDQYKEAFSNYISNNSMG